MPDPAIDEVEKLFCERPHNSDDIICRDTPLSRWIYEAIEQQEKLSKCHK